MVSVIQFYYFIVHLLNHKVLRSVIFVFDICGVVGENWGGGRIDFMMIKTDTPTSGCFNPIY